MSSNAGTSANTTNACAVGGGSNVRPNKKTVGLRGDVAWQHCIAIDGNARKVKCKHCGKIISGGVYRLKHHLARTQKDVEGCIAVPDEVRKQMWNVVASLQEKLVKKTTAREFEGDIGSTFESIDDAGKRKVSAEADGGATAANLFKRRGVSTQATVNSIFKKGVREDACMDIASFFYNNAIPFNVAKSEEFERMCASIARHGLGFKPPSYHEIRVTYLKKKVEETNLILEEHKAFWKKNGCTIMTDGWTDRRRRTILNFLVNSPKGTVFLKSIDASEISKTADKIFNMMDEVVDEIGEENVVQIVTDNAANYKAAGDLLMQKRKNLYWTPCAAHCIDLMLEDFEKNIPLHSETIATGKKITTYIYSRTGLMSLLHHFTKGGDLIRPAATRFATSYLTLGCLNDNKGALIKMFTSEQWKSSAFAKSRDGVFVENQITDKGFWKNIVNCLRGAYPLIRVLRLVDSDEKPAMGFIYEEMDRAKERIQSAFNGVRKSYIPLWKIIDKRWDKQLHRPLHAMGYYLNPMMHYSPTFKVDYEVKKRIYECLERMVGSLDERTKIDHQLEDFKSKAGMFGSTLAVRALQTKTPAQWWESYGDAYPELQKFAIRVLSLTCSSSGCERNWSAFERVHTKKRNRLKQKTMNDVVFVMVNSKINKKKQVRKTNDYSIDDLSSDDDWIVENDQNSDLDLDLDTPVQVGEDASGSGGIGEALGDDLEIPNADEGEGEGEGEADDNIDETEDHMEDDFPEIGLNAILDI